MATQVMQQVQLVSVLETIQAVREKVMNDVPGVDDPRRCPAYQGGSRFLNTCSGSFTRFWSVREYTLTTVFSTSFLFPTASCSSNSGSKRCRTASDSGTPLTSLCRRVEGGSLHELVVERPHQGGATCRERL